MIEFKCILLTAKEAQFKNIIFDEEFNTFIERVLKKKWFSKKRVFTRLLSDDIVSIKATPTSSFNIIKTKK